MQGAIKALLPNQTGYLIGFADMGALLQAPYVFRSAIALCAKLDDAVIDGIQAGPTRAYFDLYHQKNAELNQLTMKIAKFLSAHNIACLPIPATVSDDELDDEYYRTLRYGFSHKMAATRAGLGWIGKTDLFISKQFGPRVRLATVLTDYHFEEVGQPVTASKCGKCNLCVEHCPAQAATGLAWNTTIGRDEFFDAFKCMGMCRKLAHANLQAQISLCGICVAVCPIGKRGARLPEET